MENEAVYSNLFVSCDAQRVDQMLLVTDSTQRSQEPAVPTSSLTNIAGRGIILEELGIFKDILQVRGHYTYSRNAVTFNTQLLTVTRLTDRGQALSSSFRGWNPSRQSR